MIIRIQIKLEYLYSKLTCVSVRYCSKIQIFWISLEFCGENVQNIEEINITSVQMTKTDLKK